MIYIALACRLLVGGVFAVAAFGKIRSRQAFRAFAEWLADLPLIPRRAAAPFAVTVLAAELTIVALLAFPATALAGLLLAAGTLALFTAETMLAIRRGVHAPCHCFGASETPLTGSHVLRDALLCAAALVGAACFAIAPATADIALAGVALALAAACVGGALVLFFDDIYQLVSTNEI